MKTCHFSFLVLIFILLARCTNSRPLLSDGIDRFQHEDEFQDPIQLKEGITIDSNSVESTSCEQMYGFLPCSNSATGHLFLIIVYEYLVFHGESYVASGGERIFKIVGPGFFGATAFQIIGSLPEALILLASGLLSDEEIAQECVSTGVGLLAGSTILLLSLLWGTCVILASNKFTNISDHNHLETLLHSLWPGYGVVTDVETSYTARIMLISVIPLLFILILPILFQSYAGERVSVVVSLVVSVAFLVSFFIYQCFKPWIQRRRLFYIKHEHLVVDVLNHVQNETRGKLLTENGSPNVSVMRRYFKDLDHDGDNFISFFELKKFLQEIKFRTLQSGNDNLTAEIMEEFDIDSDKKITMDEFVTGMIKWLDSTKDAMNTRYHSVNSMKEMHQVLKPWIQKKREEREMMKHLIPNIVLHLQNSAYGSLLADDGTPDIAAIKRLFKTVDLDKDGCISYSELKEMTNIKSAIVPDDADIAASKIMKELDISGDNLIDEDEFVNGLSKWLNKMYNNHNSSSEETGEESYQKTWEQMDKLGEHNLIDKSLLAWMKALALLVLGISMLGILAEPLIHSVRGFSRAANVSSFFIAFILVPLATNARLAISAIREARRKNMRTTSLTLSEIYSTVFVNNVLGLVVLLSLIFSRGLSWNFAAEVLMVLVVSFVVGCLASLSTVFNVWTSVLAYLLYPLSLILVYMVGDFNRVK